MRSYKTKRFDRAFDNLPESIKKRAREAYRLFSKEPFHPRLQFKQVHPNRPIYSVRISYRYRAVGVWEDDAITWFWIGSHEDYNNLLSQL